MNLKAMNNPPTIFVIAVIVFGIALAGLFLFSRLSQNSLPPIEIEGLGIKEDSELRKTLPEIIYVGDKKKIRDKATVYFSDDKYIELNSSLAAKLARSFGFLKNPVKSGDLVIWNAKYGNFIVNLQKKEISFSSDMSKEKISNIKYFPSKERGKSETIKVLKRLNIAESNLDFAKVAVSYSSELGVEASNSDPNKAKVMILDYLLEKDGIRIYDSNNQNFNVRVKVNAGGKLVGFKAPWYPFSWEKLEDYPLKSPIDSHRTIKKGGGNIAELTTVKAGDNTQKNRNVRLINIEEVKLGFYPVVNDKSYLVPIYVFRGEASLQSVEISNIAIYDLAVPDKFLSK